MRFFPALNTATTRRQHRRDVRAALGTSSDPAPESNRVFKAVCSMQPLVSEATNGNYSLVLMNNKDEAVSPHIAYAANNEDRTPPRAGAICFSQWEITQLFEAIDPGAVHPAIFAKLAQ